MPSRADFAMAHAQEIRCEKCFAMLKELCQQSGLMPPTDIDFEVPRLWLRYVCPHTEDGIVLKEMNSHQPQALDGTSDRGDDLRSDRWKPEEEEIEPPSWKNNLDASKDVGFPCREGGRYGSYPSHDGFDDESQS